MGKDAIPFFIDNCVPASVNKLLSEAGHSVVSLRDVMPPDTKDPVIAIACASSAQVLVTCDKDFKAISKNLMVTQSDYWKLHRISFRCPDPRCSERIKHAIALIEWEWKRGRRKNEQLVIEITDAAIRVVR
jgi:hypothetical protein